MGVFRVYMRSSTSHDEPPCATPAVWNALKDICSRRRLNYHNCKEQILTMRTQAENLDVESKSMIRMDLCGYLRDRHAIYVMTQTESPTPDYDKLCAVVFSIPPLSNHFSQKWSIIKVKSGPDSGIPGCPQSFTSMIQRYPIRNNVYLRLLC